jgi:hypothetical protein
MHVAIGLLWLLSVVVMFIVGGFLGLLAGVFKGGELSHAYARQLDRRADAYAELEDDEESRLDALAVRNLIDVATQIRHQSAVGFALSSDHYRGLGDALNGCERLLDWIEWAEGATAAPGSDQDDDPYADLTNRDVDPDAVYATEADDFDDERAEARGGATV